MRLVAVVLLGAVSGVGGCLLTTPLDGYVSADLGDAGDSGSSDAADAQLDGPTAPIRVTGLFVANAANLQPIAAYDPLVDGMTVHKGTLGGAFTVVAVTDPSIIGSVGFDVDGNPEFNTEENVPYTIAGDDGGAATAWHPTDGAHSITATPYAQAYRDGGIGTGLTVTITIAP